VILAVGAGDVLAGRYLVERMIGAGSTALVAAAQHIRLGHTVAIKLMLPNAQGDTAAVARFVREARAIVKLQSEHVARVYEVETLEDGTPFIVMEYLEGHDLAHVVRTRGPLAVDEVVDLALQVCAGLHAAHSMGIVHRDVKPHNLFLTMRNGVPHVKVLDFGIVKAPFATTGVEQTASAGILGSPAYMAPEQMRSARDVDARSDLYSLGVVMYQLLAGRRPFHGETLPELCMKVLKRRAPPLRTVRRDVPARLAAAVERCLEKDPDARFPDVPSLARALAPWAPTRSRACLEALRGAAVAAPRRRFPRRMAVIAAAAAAVCAGAGVVIVTNAGGVTETPIASDSVVEVDGDPPVGTPDASPVVALPEPSVDAGAAQPSSFDAATEVKTASRRRRPVRAQLAPTASPPPLDAAPPPAAKPAARHNEEVIDDETEDFGPRK
jgi:serine/threonine-protein kinase